MTILPIPILQGSYLSAEKTALGTLDLETATSRYALATSVLSDLPDNNVRRMFAKRLGEGAFCEVAEAHRHHDGSHEAAKTDSRVQALLSILKRLAELAAPETIHSLSARDLQTNKETVRESS